MVSITFKLPDGQEQTLSVDEGESLKDAAVENEIPGIVGECGGSMACGTCHIYVDAEWIDCIGRAQDNTDESQMLEGSFAPRLDVSRLSCQVKVIEEYNGLTVAVPEELL